MGKWADKYVIGLTGNIGTGKSVVRKMLEHLGAFGIDADKVGHWIINQDGPGYPRVLLAFGIGILKDDGEIDRSKLGSLVFGNPDALRELEGIIHPLVDWEINQIICSVSQPVVVIEAIKLFEAGLASECDSAWVVSATIDNQIERLASERGMPEKMARLRNAAQSSQEEKIARADVVIRNDSGFLQSWEQVKAAWQKFVPQNKREPVFIFDSQDTDEGLRVIRGTPDHLIEIARFFKEHGHAKRPITNEDIMREFGRKSYLLLLWRNRVVGILAFILEDRMVLAMEFILPEDIPVQESLQALLMELDIILHHNRCDILVVWLPEKYMRSEDGWKNLGFSLCNPEDLLRNTWQKVTREMQTPGTTLFFKVLRLDKGK